MTVKHLDFSVTDRIGILRIDRPQKRNAMSLEMWEAVPAIMQEAEQNPAVKVIIIQGVDESAFAAGADIEEILGFTQSEAAAWRLMDAVRIAEQSIATCPKPSIAMIRGICYGGGVEIALACDLRFCSETTQFAIPPAKLGLLYSLSSTRRLAELVGNGVARDLLYSGRSFAGPEAKEIGLVERCLPHADMVAETMKYAALLCERSQYSIHGAKQILAAIRRGADDSDEAVRKVRIEAFSGEDIREGASAFLEKRKPKFTWISGKS